MLGVVIFWIAFIGGLELASKYLRKTKTKYSPEEFKKQRPRFFVITFCVFYVCVALGTVVARLADGQGLQVISSLTLCFPISLGVVAAGLMLKAVDIFLPIPVDKKQNISTKQAWLLLLFGLLIGALAYILRLVLL